ncbi:MAG: hypothetical protein JOZ82_04325 [Marmoricola sp.]|nr:hypothetical protein [Marmoricola sp.]
MAELAQVLEDVVVEVERHAAAAGWDRPATLYALVDTADLLQREPQLAEVLGITESGIAGEAGGLTPVEQEAVSDSLQDFLATIAWPPEVSGCAVVLEATTEAEGGGAEGGGDEAGGGEAGEARIVAGILRTGESACAIRQRAHDDDDLVLVGPDLVPGLLQLLHATLEPDAGDHRTIDHGEDHTDEHDGQPG